MSTSIIGTSIEKAVRLLKDGNIVAIPTETVYGLAGNGLNPDVVAKIFAAKQRPSFDPMILHTASIDRIRSFTKGIPEELLPLVEHFMPGPLSILLEKNSLVPDITTSGLPKVAVRIPNHSIALALLEKLDFPVAAPSANPFGYISPTCAQHVADQLGDRIPYILDGGNCDMGVESTIVEYNGDDIVILRKGSISLEEIEALVGKVKVKTHSTSNPKAPGMIKSHYAPRVLATTDSIKNVLKKYSKEKIGYLGWTKASKQLLHDNQRILSVSGNLMEGAKNLFSHLRELDKLDLDIIILKGVPNKGIGMAINDKIARATSK